MLIFSSYNKAVIGFQYHLSIILFFLKKTFITFFVEFRHVCFKNKYYINLWSIDACAHVVVTHLSFTNSFMNDVISTSNKVIKTKNHINFASINFDWFSVLLPVLWIQWKCFNWSIHTEILKNSKTRKS